MVTNENKTQQSENENNARIMRMTPMMAALTSNTDRWYALKASDEMWRELEILPWDDHRVMNVVGCACRHCAS